MIRSLTRYFFVLIYSATAGLVHADDVFDLSLEELLNVRVQVASRFTERALSAPATLTVFNRDDIERSGARNLPDLLALIPGMESYPGAQWGMHQNISVRGMPSVLSEGILLLRNGIPQNDPWSGSGFVVAPFLSLDFVERVEVIRGPGSSLYGANAFHAVINLITFADDAQQRRELVARAGSHSGLATQLQWQHQRWFGQLALAKNDQSLHSLRVPSDRLGNRYSNADNEIQQQEAQVALGQHTVDWQWRLDAHWQHVDQNGLMPFGFVGDDSLAKQTDQRQSWQWQGEYHQQFWWWQLQFSEVEQQQDHLYRLLPAAQLAPDHGNAGVGNFAGPQWRSKERRAQLLLHYDAAEQHWLFGGESSRTRIDEIATLTNVDLVTGVALAQWQTLQGEAAFATPYQRQQQALFAQWQTPLFTNVIVTLGWRADRYDDFGVHHSPRAAIVWQALERHTFKYLYGGAFRAPSFNELLLRNNPVVLGNSALDAERVQTQEWIWIQNWSAHWQSSLTVFDNRYNDLIELTPISATQTQYQNHRRRHLSGVEAELWWQAQTSTRWRLFASALPSNSDVTLNSAVARYLLGLSWQQKWSPNWQSDCALLWHSARIQLDNNARAAALSSRCHLQWLIDSRQQLSLSVNQLDNAQLFAPEESSIAAEGIPQARRQWQLEWRLHW